MASPVTTGAEGSQDLSTARRREPGSTSVAAARTTLAADHVHDVRRTFVPGPMPAVTIGLHVHRDDARALSRTVLSVLAQVWSGPVRLCVVTDPVVGAAQHTLEQLAARDARIEILHTDSPRRRAAARDTVLDRAGEQLVAWADLGGVWQPRKLLRQHDVLAGAGPVPVLVTGPHRRLAGAGPVEVEAPDTTGDQLRGLLEGTLRLDLCTTVGWAAALREAGPFDVGLDHRDEQEFLLRFVAAGGQLRATPGSRPLGTLDRSPRRSPAAAVAAAERRIHRDHAGLYRRYGADFARRQHRQEMERIARSYAREQAVMQARGWHARARAGRVVERLGRPGRLASIRNRVARMGTSNGGSLTDLPGVATPGTASGRPDRTPSAPRSASEEALPADPTDIPSATALTDPATWLRRARSRRAMGDIVGAQTELLEGTTHIPDATSLQLALADLHADAGDWSAAISAWERIDPRNRRGADDHTYTAIACAYRAVGDHHTAVTVGVEGQGFWPDSRGLRIELAKSRAVLTDWATSLRALQTMEGAVSSVGVVDHLGVLAGGQGPVTGWLRGGSDADPPLVQLLVNGAPIVGTHAAWSSPATLPGGHQASATAAARTFSLSCEQLLEFLGEGDVLRFTADDAPLDICGWGSGVQVVSGAPSRSADLRDRIEQGHVFTKFGRLRPGYTPDRKRRTLELFDRVAEVVHERTGATCTPFYGNLLGTVRDHDFIPHDVGGFDAGYLSRQPSPAAVRAELLGLGDDLLAEGFHLEVEPFGLMIRERPGDQIFVDLNVAWFTPESTLGLSYGWRYPPIRDPEQLRPTREGVLAGRLVPIPHGAEEVLVQLYGPNWSIPDQGFDPSFRLQRDERYLLTAEEMGGLRDEAPDRVRIVGTVGDADHSSS